MSNVHLNPTEVNDPDEMPRVCLVCGANAKMKHETFEYSYHPTFLGIPNTRVRMIRTAEVAIPVCRKHKDYFARNRMWGMILVLIVVTLIFVAVLTGIFLRENGVWIFAPLIIAAICMGFGIVLGSNLMKFFTVHASYIDEDGVDIANVSRDFVDELERLRDERYRDTRREEIERTPRGIGAGSYMTLAAVIVLFMMCGGGVSLVGFVAMKSPTKAKTRRSDSNRIGSVDNSQPIPWEDRKLRKVYLSTLKELGSKVGYGKFENDGRLGYGLDVEWRNDPIKARGQRYHRGISMHPPRKGASWVAYKLDKKYKVFRGTVAIADDPRNRPPQGDVFFEVLGDRKIIWRSPKITETRHTESCRLNVSDVDVLMLRVYCPGNNTYARAVWLDPYLLK